MDESATESLESSLNAMARLVLNDSVAQERNWAELPRDVLVIIFRKMGAIDVLNNAQWVCRPWRELSLEPQAWQVVDVTMHKDRSSCAYYLEKFAREAIHRSNGLMEEFHARNFGDRHLTMHIAERAKGLKVLRLLSCRRIPRYAVLNLVRNSSKFESLEISLPCVASKFIQAVGKACPQLKRFGLIHRPNAPFNLCEMEALAIADSMKELQHLELVGSQLNNEPLHAILDNCPHLESLYLHRCYLSTIQESLRKKLARIKDLRLPSICEVDNDELIDIYSMCAEDFDCKPIRISIFPSGFWRL